MKIVKLTRKIYQIHILLDGSSPRIWRRLLIPSDLILPDFHKIIQTTMGWSNEHLHQFIKDKKFYTPINEFDDFVGEMNDINYEKIKVSDFLKKEKDKMRYQYDFGDSWRHSIVLEKILQDEMSKAIPICLKGKNRCPPEDCGGVWGYHNLLTIMNDPKHEEHSEMMEWIGGYFDPSEFDMEIVNEMLAEEDYGCYEFF